jgi:DHA1 family tetracycline resistance protein-like MFS transporter
MGRAILLARADMVPGHTLAFAKEVARQAQVNLVLGLVTTRLGSWLASRADKVGPDRALADSFALAGLINIAAMMGAFWLMAETLPRASRIPFSFRTSNPLSFVSFFGRSRMLLRLGIISSLMNICHQQSYEGLFHMRQYGWGVAQRTRHVMWHKLVQFFNFYPFPALAQRLGLYGTLKIGLRLSGVLWIGSALTRNGAVNYVDSVAMLGIHKLKVLEMAKAAEADRVGATYGQMRAAEVSLGRLLGMVFTPIWNEVYALGVRRGWTGGAHVLRGAIQLLCSEIALPGMFSGGLGVDDLEG